MSEKQVILIVEDDESMRSILAKKMQGAGYEVLVASDGREGINICLKKKPDLVILDLVMPQESGFEFLEQLRVKHKLDTPVIVMTNLDQRDDKEMVQNFKVSEYLVKSGTSLSALLAKVKEVLG